MELSASIKATITVTFFVYTFALIIIAFISGRKMAHIPVEKYVDEFYTGGRTMGAIFVALITAAGICSAGTFVGGPGLTHKLGLGYGLVNLFSFIFTTVIVTGTIGKKMGIIARRIKATTYMDVLSARYNDNKVLLFSGVIVILTFMVAYCASQFMGGARMLEVVTGIKYSFALALFAVVVIAYSTFGGIRGTGLATILQGIVMTVGSLALGIGSLRYAGGFSKMFYAIEAYNPTFIQPQSFSMGWILSLWVIFGFVYLAMPHGTLGVLAFKNSLALHRATFLGAILVPIWAFSMNITGLASIALFPGLEVADHTTPLMAATVLNPVLAGLVIAGAGAAIQSTIAAMILAISGTLVKNVYARMYKKASAKRLRTISITFTFLTGIATYIFALNPPPELEWIVIFAIGGLASAFFWPMLLGLYWWRMNQWGAVGGVIIGLLMYIIGKGVYPPLAMGLDPVIIGMVSSLIASVVLSLITSPTDMKTLQIFWGAEPVKEDI